MWKQNNRLKSQQGLVRKLDVLVDLTLQSTLNSFMYLNLMCIAVRILPDYA